MPNWPAAKLGDAVLGLDFHTVIIPPAPAPVPMVPHPYFGSVFLWLTPTWPKMDVFVNGMPVCGTGAQGLSCHIPSVLPAPPPMTNLQSYWKRHLLNVPKALMLAMLTIFANIAISMIAALIPKPPAVENFIKDVTGIDTSNSASMWESIKGAFSSYTQWQTWVKLLIPPLPYPGSQGSVAIGSPTVTANGAPIAFVAPLMAASCSDLPFVPNAAVLGFSNVLVGVSLADMARAIAVNAAQGAVSAGVQKAASALGGGRRAVG
jgi:hypothetical protein